MSDSKRYESQSEEELDERGQVTYFDKLGVPVPHQPNGQPTNGAQRIYMETEEPLSNSQDYLCGFGPFHPKWLQVFASKKAFMLVFSMLAIVQGMSWAYFTATITTLEKRFKISSQTSGITMTGNEISQILFSIFIAYYGARGHRPRWIAVGVLLSAFSCFVLASPHIFYGPGSDALSLTKEYAHLFDSDMGRVGTTLTPGFGIETSNASLLDSIPKTKSKVQACKRNPMDGGSTLTDCEAADVSIAPLILIFISQFVSGIGVLLFFSLGGPYLDDNIEKTKSAMMFGITMSLRLVGPTMGFLFAGYCLKLFISPTLTPLIEQGDPRFLGAWWLGWVVLGTLMALTSVTIALFPRELPRAVLKKKLTSNMSAHHGSQVSLARVGSQMIATAEKAVEIDTIPKLSDMPKAVKILLTNKTNLYNTLAGVFYLFSAIGYWTYMPKYLQTVFMQTASSASVISGIISIAFQSIGLLLSGFLISKYQPSARMLAGWNVFLGFLYVIVKASFTQMGCEAGTPRFGDFNTESGMWNLTTGCNVDCNCMVNKIQPVCHQETQELYYSACHAGCASVVNGSISGCSCIADPTATVTLGTCNDGCFTTFAIFLAVNAVIKLLDSSGRIGNMLVSYRCVDPKDKSLAIGVSIFFVSFFAMLPSPILFGKIFDSVCMVWGTKCGGRGNCWLYDGETLRYWFNLTAAAFTGIGAVFDCLVWWYVKDLDLYDEEKNIRNRQEETLRKKALENIPR